MSDAKKVHETLKPAEVREQAAAVGIMFDGMSRASLDRETRMYLDAARKLFEDFFVPLAIEGAEHRDGKE